MSLGWLLQDSPVFTELRREEHEDKGFQYFVSKIQNKALLEKESF